jgi:hypothetical protein
MDPKQLSEELRQGKNPHMTALGATLCYQLQWVSSSCWTG